jgi:hypothetical protein
MKKLFLLLLLVGCAEAPPPSSMGATSQDMNWVPGGIIPVITGSNALIVLVKVNGGRSVMAGGTVNRIFVSLRCDQPVTLLFQVNRSSGGGTVWRTLNGWNSGDPVQGHPAGCTDASPGRGLGDTVAANTDVSCDYLVLGANSRVEVMTGSPGPTACEVDLGLFVDRAPGM